MPVPPVRRAKPVKVNVMRADGVPSGRVSPKREQQMLPVAQWISLQGRPDRQGRQDKQDKPDKPVRQGRQKRVDPLSTVIPGGVRSSEEGKPFIVVLVEKQ